MKHLTDAELRAEWARAAYVVAVFGGPFSWGAHTNTLHRFLTTPHA